MAPSVKLLLRAAPALAWFVKEIIIKGSKAFSRIWATAEQKALFEVYRGVQQARMNDAVLKRDAAGKAGD